MSKFIGPAYFRDICVAVMFFFSLTKKHSVSRLLTQKVETFFVETPMCVDGGFRIYGVERNLGEVSYKHIILAEGFRCYLLALFFSYSHHYVHYAILLTVSLVNDERKLDKASVTRHDEQKTNVLIL